MLLSVVVYHTILGYHYLTFGIYYIAFTEVFDTTKATAGFISSIHGLTASALSEFHPSVMS